MEETKYIALVGEDGAFLADKLKKDRRIAEVVILPRDEMLDTPISGHADTILCLWQNKILCHENYYKKNKVLLDRLGAVVPCEGKRSGRYPEDVAFNALVAGKILIGRRASLTPALKDDATDTNQGYAACGGAYIDGCVVSADTSIIKSAAGVGLETCKISGRDIMLEGYNTGFVGGATAYLDGTVFLCGDSGESAEEIMRFAESRELKVVRLAEGMLRDIGGIKFIKSLYKTAD